MKVASELGLKYGLSSGGLILNIIFSVLIFVSSGFAATTCPPEHEMAKPDTSKIHAYLRDGISVTQPVRTNVDIVLAQELSADQIESCFGFKPVKLNGRIVNAEIFISRMVELSGSNLIEQIGRGRCTGKDISCQL